MQHLAPTYTVTTCLRIILLVTWEPEHGKNMSDPLATAMTRGDVGVSSATPKNRCQTIADLLDGHETRRSGAERIGPF